MNQYQNGKSKFQTKWCQKYPEYGSAVVLLWIFFYYLWLRFVPPALFGAAGDSVGAAVRGDQERSTE